MAALAVSAELAFRDGQRQKVCVQVENSLTSVVRGIHELTAKVSQLLSALVEQEKAHSVCAQGEDEEDSSEEDEKPQDALNSRLQPPAKRPKT